MVNLTGPSSDDPQQLLSTTRDLTRRVRIAQRGAWFPLLVFAAVTFAAIPFNRYGRHAMHCGSLHGGGKVCVAYSSLALWYWPLGLLAGYAAISWFYIRRSHQRGVGTRVLPYVAVGTVLVVAIMAWAVWADTHPAFLAGALRLPTDQPIDALNRLANPATAIGFALLLLAWIERSWQLLALTVAYLFVAVATVGLGSFADPTPWAFLPHFLVDAGVLAVGGVLLAVAQRAQGPSSA